MGTQKRTSTIMPTFQYRQSEFEKLYQRFFYVAPPFPRGNIDLTTSIVNTSLRKSNLSKISKYSKAVVFDPLYVNGVELPNCVFTIDYKNNIVYTPLTGFNGSVKQLMGNDDYRINVLGICINETENVYPEDQIKQLKSIASFGKSMEVVNSILGMLDIHKVVLESLRFIQKEGQQNALGYELQMVSDFDYIANINDNILEYSGATA